MTRDDEAEDGNALVHGSTQATVEAAISRVDPELDGPATSATDTSAIDGPATDGTRAIRSLLASTGTLAGRARRRGREATQADVAAAIQRRERELGRVTTDDAPHREWVGPRVDAAVGAAASAGSAGVPATLGVLLLTCLTIVAMVTAAPVVAVGSQGSIADVVGSEVDGPSGTAILGLAGGDQPVDDPVGDAEASTDSAPSGGSGGDAGGSPPADSDGDATPPVADGPPATAGEPASTASEPAARTPGVTDAPDAPGLDHSVDVPPGHADDRSDHRENRWDDRVNRSDDRADGEAADAEPAEPVDRPTEGATAHVGTDAASEAAGDTASTSRPGDEHATASDVRAAPHPNDEDEAATGQSGVSPKRAGQVS